MNNKTFTDAQRPDTQTQQPGRLDLAEKIALLLKNSDPGLQSSPLSSPLPLPLPLPLPGQLIKRARQCHEVVQSPPVAAAFIDELISLLRRRDEGNVAEGIAGSSADNETDHGWLLRESFARCVELLQGNSSVTDYFWVLNELRSVQNKPLLSELLFALPPEYSAAKNDGLVSVLPTASDTFDATEFYRRYHESLHAALNQSDGQKPLDQLSALCREVIDADSHEYAAIFWLACSCYIGGIESVPKLSAAHQTVLRQIELVIRQHVVDADSHILSPEGIELAERTLCNMLTYIACVAPADPVFERLEATFRMLKSLSLLDHLPVASNEGAMLDAGVHTLRRRIARLKLDVDALPDAGSEGVLPALASTREIRDICTLLCSREELSVFESAVAGLKNYQSRDGAVGDLETSAAALIRADQLLAEKFSGLADDSDHVASDDAKLNVLLVDEILLMLNPVCDADDTADHEWLKVALTDVLSATAFVTDPFLIEQMAGFKRCVQNEVADLRLLASHLRDYLQFGKAAKDTAEAREKLLAMVSVKPAGAIKEPRDHRVDFAALASDNSDLLRDDVTEDSSNLNAVTTAEADAPGTEQSNVQTQNTPVAASSLEFGDQCNRYVDTIQHALDTALGSSGNLAPDATVTAALDNLYNVVRSAEHDPLLKLIEPLSQVLGSAERAGSTLSQSDTLLVQEAIVAITIGLDAVVNKQPMPELVADVAGRITQVAVDDSHNARGGFEAAGLIDVFVEEAEDLGQRLFELFQRWRGAPQSSQQGGTRLQTDIRRLVHTLKGSADTVGLGHIAAVAHALESFMANRSGSETAPASDFFDNAIEAIEVILDDVDRVRNGESVANREEILSLLESPKALTADPEISALSADTQQTSATVNCDGVDDYIAEKTPAFGSAKYFSELERSQQRLSRQHWECHELHEKLRNQLIDMQSSLQSARHLLSKVPSEPETNPVARSINESFSDLHELQAALQRTLDRISAIEEQQLTGVVELESLVLTSDRISVESVRLRMESLVQRVAAAQNTPVRFEFTGADLELDRKLFAEVNGPLEQLLINAVVHGAQSSTVRMQQGKSAELTIRVAFAIRNGNLSITVADDGGGVNINKLREQLTRRTQVGQLSDTEVLSKIVDQGITTSDVANRAAGRGVGLDVVKEWVYRRFGDFSVKTGAIDGTVFSLSVPLQLESIIVMVVRHGEQFYAIDIARVVEIKDAAAEGVSLAAILGQQNTGKESVAAQADNSGADTVRAKTVISCQTQDGTLNLEVEEIIGRKTVRFNTNDRLLSASDLYQGCGLMDNRHIVLRLNTDNFRRYATEQQVTREPQPTSASVLIVDDSVTIRASFGRAMQTAGYNIVLARNGLEAMEYLEAHQPEVIILDLEMPLMDGYELGAHIRKDPRLSRTALVVVSSKPKAVVGEWLSAVNADAYYEKPCSESVIAGVVAGLV